MQDLYELFEIMLEGHHSGKLQNTGEFQTNVCMHYGASIKQSQSFSDETGGT